MSDKVNGIEQNVEKNNRRVEIATQVATWLRYSKAKELISASLPAEHWYGEHVMANILTGSNLKHLESMTFHGAEDNKKVAIESIRNMPDNSTLVHNSFHYLLTREMKHNNNKMIGYILEDVIDHDKDYNFIWADYCGNPNNAYIRNCGIYMANMTQGLFYVTFRVSGKQVKGGLQGLCKKIGISSKDVEGGIIKKLKESAKKHGAKRVPKLVYSVLYRGGKLGGTDMLTVGFVVGDFRGFNIQERVGLIRKDVRDNTALNLSRNNLYYRISNDPKLFQGRKRKVKSTYTNTKTTIEEKEKIRKMLSFGYDSKTIADNLGISIRSVGAIKAHVNNPESFKVLKRKRKRKRG